MTQHVPDDLLQSFVDGDVAEQLAVPIAEHLDACPSCATRATALEPLAHAFAAVSDPIPPPGLGAAVLARLDRPERLPIAEVTVGAVLLMCASILAVTLDSPLSMAADLGVAINGLAALGRGLSSLFSSFQIVLALVTIATLVGSFFTLRFAVLPATTAVRRLP